jgi:hypothetical protein
MISSKHISLLAIVFFINCTEKIITECEETDQLDTVKKMTFNEIQSQVFNTSCAKSGCHAGISPAAQLDLSENNSYNNIVNVPSRLNPAQFHSGADIPIDEGDWRIGFMITRLLRL